jgi:CubicO group peptidase (beta-lactamase class C family)
VLVYRRGDLLLEEYFPGTKRWDGAFYEFDRSVLHDVFSVTKSFTSAAVGIAIEEGHIQGVDQPVVEFFPELTSLGGNLEDGSLQIQHLLSMSAGIEWNELDVAYDTPTNDHSRMNASEDQIRYVFERPTAAAPGTSFTYNSGLSMTLGEIVARATGEPLPEYLQSRLFGSLGVTDLFWYEYPSGITHAGGGLQLHPRDLVKFGVLYLDGGLWSGDRLLPEGWVEASTSAQVPDEAYGYQWWLDSWIVSGRTVEGYSAVGLGGQFIFVVPELELVAVFTSNNDGDEMFLPMTLMRRYVLPVVD